MRLLFLASHAWSELTDRADLEAVVASLMATLSRSGPVQIYAPANRYALVEVLEQAGWFPTVFSEADGPPGPRYDRAFFLSPTPLTPDIQMMMDTAFSNLADTWMVVHVPLGSGRALVQTGRRSDDPDLEWQRPLDWDDSDVATLTVDPGPVEGDL